MPSPNWKVSFFFESYQNPGDYGGGSAVGWTETWYIPSSAGYDTAHNALISWPVYVYRQLRMRILPTIYTLVWVRVSDVGNPRNTKVMRVTPVQNGLKATAPAQVTCAILIDFAAPDTQSPPQTHHRRFLLRGLINAWINGNVIVDSGPGFADLLTFLNWLTGGQVPQGIGPQDLDLSSKFTVRTLTTQQTALPIVSLVPSVVDDHQILVTTAPAMPAPVRGTKYLIKGVKTPYFCNRVWQDTGAALITGQSTLGRSRRSIAGAYTGAGSVTPVSPQYYKPNQFTIIGVRTRHIGRPTHLSRGKRNPII